MPKSSSEPQTPTPPPTPPPEPPAEPPTPEGEEMNAAAKAEMNRRSA